MASVTLSAQARPSATQNWPAYWDLVLDDISPATVRVGLGKTARGADPPDNVADFASWTGLGADNSLPADTTIIGNDGTLARYQRRGRYTPSMLSLTRNDEVWLFVLAAPGDEALAAYAGPYVVGP